VTRAPLGPTYRVQLRPDWTLDDAAGIVPYLAALGIDSLYCSPILEAVAGSMHGYDGTDPSRVRAELGGEPALERLCTALHAHGLGLVVDIVPNHLAAHPSGPWWRDVLAHGEHSRFASVFAIDWAGSPTPGRVTLPLIDRPLADAIADGIVRLGQRDGTAVLLVDDLDLPLNGAPRPGASVEEICAAQHYRLADWHDLSDRNYRRFFDIDGLVAVRVEHEAVFDLLHARIVTLCATGIVRALRVDHLDGLADPLGYLRRLERATGGVPILIEKILLGDETLDPRWPVAGTTGYEHIDDLDGALVDAAGLDALRRAGRRAGDLPVAEAIAHARAETIRVTFADVLDRVATELGVDPGRIGALVRHMHRYRTYAGTPTDVLDAAAGDDYELVTRLRAPNHRAALVAFEQLCVSVMAKGVEDTAGYRLLGPLAFCEVGGDPGLDRTDGIERLHDRAAERAADGRPGLVPGTTHDTKRSADARARLLALGEHPDALDDGLSRLARSAAVPGDLERELRLVASLMLATLPAEGALQSDYGERLGTVVTKALREEKRRTNWLTPDLAYESEVSAIVDRLVVDDAAVTRAALGELAFDVARLGAVLSVSMVALRHVLPGTPDCYQGEETWSFSLVDPDNRLPVDHANHAAMLAALPDAEPNAVAALRRAWPDGRLKLHCTRAALHLRRDVPGALAPTSAYRGLAVKGPVADAVLAASRANGAVIAIATRHPSRLAADPRDLPYGTAYAKTVVALEGSGTYLDVLSGARHRATEGELDLAAVLGVLPVALLRRIGDDEAD
jgi:(1->4)-alpha-D-glucan 1-alpha-D-glucosylmutase